MGWPESFAWRRVTESTYPVRAEYRIAEQQGRVGGVLPLFRTGGRVARLFSPPGGLLADDAQVAAALLDDARGQLERERLHWVELRDQRVAWPGLETNTEHVTMVREKLRRCCQQREDLTDSLGDLLHDIFTGRKLLKVYRQMKMYNDPALNPYLYQPQKLAG